MHHGWQERVTAREEEVLALVRRHWTNAQIAEALHLSSRTVESHVTALLRKSGAEDRRDLARMVEASADEHRVVGLRTYDTLLVGRDQLLADLLPYVSRDAHATSVPRRRRAVSLVGPGGVGKTRLLHELLAAAQHDWDRVVVVDLLPVTSERVASAAGAAWGIEERTGLPAREALMVAVGERPVLLALDNAEHLLIEVAELVDPLMARCPAAVVVVTSREPLRIACEQVVGVTPLTGAQEQDAAALFGDRAGLEPDDVPRSLIRSLDGLPLCLELAAARVASLGLEGLSAALAEPLMVLVGGRALDKRHRSARAVVSWSYALLDDVERRALRDLGTVHHDIDLATAAALTGLSEAHAAVVLASLTEKSLLTRRRESTARWALSQVVREFVTEAASQSPAEQVARAARVQRWAQTRAQEWVAQPDATPEPGELTDLVTIALEQSHGSEQTGASARSGTLPRTVAVLCARAGRLNEAVDCLAAAATHEGVTTRAVEDLLEAAALSGARGTAGDRASLLPVRAAELAASCGAEDLEVRSLATAVAHRHRYPVTAAFNATLPRTRDLLDRALGRSHHDSHTAAALAVAEAWQDRGTGTAQRAVLAAERTSDPAVIAGALDVLADAYAQAGLYRQARRAALRRLSLLRGAPAGSFRAVEEIIDAQHMAARTALVIGDLAAFAGFEPGAAGPRADDLMELPWLVRFRALQGRFDEAVMSADRLWAVWERAGSRPTVWMGTAGAAAVLATGVCDESREHVWRERMLRLAGADTGYDVPMLAAFLSYVDARLALHRSELADAEMLVARCSRTFSDRWYEGFARGAGAELAMSAGLPADALLAQLQIHAQQSDWASATYLRCLAELEPAAGHWEASVSLWERIGAAFELSTTLRAGRASQSAGSQLEKKRRGDPLGQLPSDRSD